MRRSPLARRSHIAKPRGSTHRGHEIMPEAHEQVEHAEHIEHASHTNKKIALLIAVLALFLALSETLGKSAQVDALNMNIDASDKWNFFQAKTVRQTVLR